MISEFQDLSLKIDQLAELTAALRRENAELRQTNVQLAADNAQHRQRLAEARQRIGALIAQIPVPADDEPGDGSADPAADHVVAAGAEVAR
ncbi:MAG: hypothetical protein JWP59_2869 [Massilia sp.]|jgi:cell division protein ZapB|nr:hypothetical protein [Massilia sp.]